MGHPANGCFIMIASILRTHSLRIPTVSLIAILLISCIGIGGGKGPVIITEENAAHYDSIGAFRYQDSIIVHAVLNDTIFHSMQIERALKSSGDGTIGDVPLVDVSLSNRSSLDLRVPYRVNIYPCDGVWFSGFYMLIAKKKGSINTPALYRARGHEGMESDFFRVLKAGESMRRFTSISFIECLGLETLEPGEYYTSVAFRSYWWEDGDPPVYLGTAVSDTTWFRVIE